MVNIVNILVPGIIRNHALDVHSNLSCICLKPNKLSTFGLPLKFYNFFESA